MQATARISLCLLAALAVSGCKTLDRKDEPESDQPGQRAGMKIPVGTIHVVDPEGRFVLIRSSRTFKVESGTQMTSYGGDGTVTGIFEVSPARKGAFLTADILQGSPTAGEQVLMDYSKPSVPASGTPQQTGTSSDVQVLE